MGPVVSNAQRSSARRTMENGVTSAEHTSIPQSIRSFRISISPRVLRKALGFGTVALRSLGTAGTPSKFKHSFVSLSSVQTAVSPFGLHTSSIFPLHSPTQTRRGGDLPRPVADPALLHQASHNDVLVDLSPLLVHAHNLVDAHVGDHVARDKHKVALDDRLRVDLADRVPEGAHARGEEHRLDLEWRAGLGPF